MTSKTERRKEMGQWIRFFVGTPQRFMATLAALGMIIAIISPDLLATAMNRLFAAVIQPALIILLVYGALRVMFKGGK